MWHVAVIVVLLLIAFLFVGLNMHTTQINFPFTKGYEMRTVFLLAVSFFLGYGTACLVGLARNLKSRRK